MQDPRQLLEITWSDVVSVLLSDGWHPTEDFQVARCKPANTHESFAAWDDVVMWHEAGVWIVCPTSQVQAIKKRIERHPSPSTANR